MKQRSITVIDTKTLESIFDEVETIRRALAMLRKKILRLLPSEYGSERWWENEMREADAEIQTGKIRELHSVEELDKPFDKLFS